ncbi:MAG: hypothetical protein ACI9OJ_004891 [Myxococcota bacterium]|jgi:hypothetical protein
MQWKMCVVAGAFTAGLWAAPTSAEAFCGFYVSDSEVELGNDSSFVVLLRDGTKTVMTMRNSYVGPAADFALVVPIPVSIGEDDVHVVNEEVLEQLERFTSPRLVEYWENEPRCPSPLYGRTARFLRIRSGSAQVTVETSFAVGEYDFVVLGANDSLSLERYLTRNGYQIPENAAPLLRPYVAQGYRFLVAKVDATRVTFVDGRAVLSPIRIAYDSPRFELPIRLGLANSRGEQDVVAVVISRDGRFEVANRRNVFVPTNLEVRPAARERFTELYASILDRTFERNPGAVITEHAWATTGCDPCTGPALGVAELDQLGGDVITGAEARATTVRQAHFTHIERRSGDGHSFSAVSTYLDDRRVQISRCGSDSRGTTETYADFSFNAGGVLTRLSLPGSSNRYGPCLARTFRHSRLMHPPLGTGHSQWRVQLEFRPGYRQSQVTASGFTATRLHLRVRPGGDTSDLVFRQARSVVGGVGTPNAAGDMPRRTTSHSGSTFQARYAVLHRRQAPMACEGTAIHMGWGGSRGRRSALHAEITTTSSTTVSSTDPIADLIVAVPSELRRRRSARTSIEWRPRPSSAEPWNHNRLPPGEPVRDRVLSALRATRRSIRS